MSNVKSKWREVAALSVAVVGHLAGITTVALTVLYLILPHEYVRLVADRVMSVPQVGAMSTIEIALHVALSTCIWAFLFLLFQIVRGTRERREVRAIRLRRGSVMTETIIVLPVLLLLTFGMAQLAIANIAGILANVAAYEGARAAWIWKPEETAQRLPGVSSGIAKEKCQTAVALVMTPVAPGNYLTNPFIPSRVNKMRLAVSLDQFTDLSGFTNIHFDAVATRKYQSMTRALDNTGFAIRSFTKFTHAYPASKCKISTSGKVTMKFMLQIAMPMMGPVFGKFKYLGPGMTPGYYATYKRDLKLTKQRNKPNGQLPQNELLNPATPSKPNVAGKIKDKLG